MSDPKEGCKIRCRRKGDEWRDGIVSCVWKYDGTSMVDLVEGGTIIPSFGDEWVYT